MDSPLEIAASLRLTHGDAALAIAQRDLFAAGAAHDTAREALLRDVCALLLEQQAAAGGPASSR